MAMCQNHEIAAYAVKSEDNEWRFGTLGLTSEMKMSVLKSLKSV
jgi:hypothetical protein